MLDSTALDVAIGIVLVYTILSLVCTVLNEWVSGVLNMRARTLKRGVMNLLNDPGFTSLAQKVYQHGLVDGLSQGKTSNGRRIPSYIAGHTFALSLLDTLAHPARANPAQAQALPPEVDPPIVPLPADQPVTPLPTPASLSSIAESFGEIVNSVQALPDGHTKQALLTLIAEARGDADKLQKSVADWFDGSMERVSGWYKRWTQTVLLVLATLVVGVLNADTIALAKRLNSDNALRASVVAAAGNLAQKPGLPAGDSVRPLLEDTAKLNLPLGWNRVAGDPFSEDVVPHLTNPIGLLQKVCGLMVSAAMVSLGAPFWFDILQKVMRLRTTGKKPEQQKAVES